MRGGDGAGAGAGEGEGDSIASHVMDEIAYATRCAP